MLSLWLFGWLFYLYSNVTIFNDNPRLSSFLLRQSPQVILHMLMPLRTAYIIWTPRLKYHLHKYKTYIHSQIPLYVFTTYVSFLIQQSHLGNSETTRIYHIQWLSYSLFHTIWFQSTFPFLPFYLVTSFIPFATESSTGWFPLPHTHDSLPSLSECRF